MPATKSCSDLHGETAPPSKYMPPRERLEPLEPMPLQRGVCDWCGAKVKGRVYCNPACRRSYNNLLAAQGKSVMQTLKLWRKHRGAKGTAGQGKLSDAAARIDVILTHDRERKAHFQAQRAAKGKIA